MDFLYQLCCLPKSPSVDINDLKGSNFNQFLDISCKSAEHINRDQTFKHEATDEFIKLLSRKSNSPSNTLRTINSLFESAISASHSKDRDLLEWLQVLVNSTVKYGQDPKSIKTPPLSEKPLPSPKQSPKKTPSSDETDVSWEEDDGDQYEYIGSSDDDYVPSGDDAVVPGKQRPSRKSTPKKATTAGSKPVRRKKKLQDQVVPDSPPKSPKKNEATIPLIKEGAGPKALTKYFLEMDTKSVKSSKSVAALPQGYYAKSFFFPSKDSFNVRGSIFNPIAHHLFRHFYLH